MANDLSLSNHAEWLERAVMPAWSAALADFAHAGWMPDILRTGEAIPEPVSE